MTNALQGAGQGAVAGSMVSPGWGTVIGAGLGLAGSLLGGQAAGQTYHDAKQLAEKNAQLQMEINRQNQAWAQHILDISHPQMSGTDLGNLLFSQGQQEATRQHDIDLATTLRQNLRAGSPMSTGDVIGAFDRQNAGQWQDKLASARLQGILGVLPGASALNIAGAVGKGTAPQINLSPDVMALGNNATANTLASVAQVLQPILGKWGQTQSGNTGNAGTLGNTGSW